MGWFRYFRRAHRDRQLCRELESYIDIETDVNVARGMTLDDARLAARRKLGHRTAIREEVYIMNSAALVETLWQDAAYAMRAFWKNKAWTATAVLTLALGIGANTAIFSVVDAVLFHPLPYQEPNRLMAVRETFVPRFPVFAVAPGSFLEWRMQNTTFERLAAVSTSALNLTGGDEPERLPAARVSEGLFELLGMPPALGRGFTAAEMEPGRDLAVVLSYGLWQRRFGGDPELIGQAITLSDRRYTVIGIAPRGLAFPTQDTQLWTPLALTAEQWDNYGGRYLRVFGRLTAEVTLEQARAEMLTIAARIEQARPDTNTGWSVSVVGLHEVIVGDTRPALLVLAAAVGLVLLIACANVANMLLARAASREQEIAVRMALGASRRRVVRQLLTESLLLALAGATGGVLLAAWGTTVLPSLAPAELPRIDQIRFDGGTLLFTLVVGLLTGVLFGLVPALQASRHGLHERLKNGGRGSSAGRGQLLRSGLVVAEMGLAVMLLIGAGLLIQSFAGLQRADPGSIQTVRWWRRSISPARRRRRSDGRFMATSCDASVRFRAWPRSERRTRSRLPATTSSASRSRGGRSRRRARCRSPTTMPSRRISSVRWVFRCCEAGGSPRTTGRAARTWRSSTRLWPTSTSRMRTRSGRRST